MTLPNTVNPDLLAEQVIANPTVLGPVRAWALFNLATSPERNRQNRNLGRRALQAAAFAAHRDSRTLADGSVVLNRVFSKASNQRLLHWAQNQDTPV